SSQNIVGLWTHVAGTFDGTTQKLYVNGQLVNQRIGASFKEQSYMLIGAIRFAGVYQSFFQGEIDELRIWNHARTEQELRDNMSQSLLGNEVGLMSYWRFDEGAGNQTFDSSPAGYAGSFSSPTWQPSGAPLQCALGQCSFVAPKGEYSNLVGNSDGTYTRTLKNGTKIHFNAQGLHTSTVDRNGNSTTYSYDADTNLIQITDPVGLVTSLTYDINQKLDTIVDPQGRVTTFVHDLNGNLIQIIAPDGSMRQFSYDANHRLIGQTNKRNFSTSYEYNFAGRVVKANHPDGSTRELTPIQTIGLVDMNSGLGTKANPSPLVQPADAQAQFIDGNNNTTVYETNAFGSVTKSIDALGRETLIERDENNNSTRTTRANGAVNSLTYDAQGNVLSTTEESIGATTSFEYEQTFNQVTKITDAEGNVQSIQYNTEGNTTKIINAQLKETTFTYNTQGQILTSTDALGNTTQFNYDVQGYLQSTIDPLGFTTSFTYDSAGNVISNTDAEGNTTTFTYDILNQLTQVTDALGGTTQYIYDSNGNLLSVTDAKNQITSYIYDVKDRLLTTTDPLGKVESYTYDTDGQLISLTDRKNQTIGYSYDVVKQLIQKNWPTGEVIQYTYDLVGNLTSIEDTDSKITYSYDPVNRLNNALTTGSTSQPDVTLSYSYDQNNNRISMTDSLTGTINYTYDTLDRLTGITTPSSETTSFTYDELNRRTNVGFPNGVTTDYQYDAKSQLTSLIHKLGTTIQSSFGYTYDNTGNRTNLNTTRASLSVNNSLNYTYDNLYRLTTATDPLPAQPDETFSYDPVGNRLQDNSQTNNATYDAGNRLLENDTHRFTYDNNGNMTQKVNKVTNDVTDYTYNVENQLVEIKINTVTIGQYFYDGQGRRIAKSASGVVKTYVYDQEDILLEFDATNTLKAHYIHGLGIDEAFSMRRDLNENTIIENNEKFYYHPDALGSIMDITDSTGLITQSYVYNSFGEIVQQVGALENPYTYTGREIDNESGLYYYRARYYDPSIGRFITEDPIGFDGGINFYAYVLNNPIRYRDPFGKSITLPPPVLPPLFCPINPPINPNPQPQPQPDPPEPDPPEPPDCDKIRDLAIDFCSDTSLPTQDNGFEFWNCVNKFMKEHGC
ncbi:Rhs family protein, partial [hydrothermal vent metagenome]